MLVLQVQRFGLVLLLLPSCYPNHHFPFQVLQAMGYPTGFDSDLDPLSSDEKSDGEGKSETSSHTSNNPTHSSDGSNTLEVSAERCLQKHQCMLNNNLKFVK